MTLLSRLGGSLVGSSFFFLDVKLHLLHQLAERGNFESVLLGLLHLEQHLHERTSREELVLEELGRNALDDDQEEMPAYRVAGSTSEDLAALIPTISGPPRSAIRSTRR